MNHKAAFSVLKTIEEVHEIAKTKALEAMQIAALYPIANETPASAYRNTYANWVNHYEDVSRVEMLTIAHRTWFDWLFGR